MIDQETNTWWLRMLLAQIFDTTPADRARGYWIVGTDVMNTLRQVKDSHGQFIWLPPVDFKGDGYMLKYAVEVRDDAIGARFTTRA